MTVQENLGILVRDARFSQYGQFFRKDYSWVCSELKALNDENISSLPGNFFEKGVKPLVNFLEILGEVDFDIIFFNRPDDMSKRQVKKLDYYKDAIPQIVDALLQRSHSVTYGASKSFTEDLDAFQVAVTEVYHRVVSGGGDRLAPLVKWDHVTTPHTILSFDCKKLDKNLENVNFGVVSLPIGNKFGGVISWGLIGHEVGGHLLLSNHPELLPELKKCMSEYVKEYWEENGLPTKQKEKALGIWESWTEEIICDILGILVLGPPSVVCSLAYFRAIRDKEQLSNISNDRSHPPDILRVEIGLKFLKKIGLSQQEIDEWNGFFKAEILKDRPKKNKVETVYRRAIFDLKEAVSVGTYAVNKLTSTHLRALNRSLVEVVNWTENDTALINLAQNHIKKRELTKQLTTTYSSRHVISGAITLALENGNSVEEYFTEMKKYLAKKYRTTPFLGQDPKKFGLQ